MAFGLTDIAMNAQGSSVERPHGRPVMNGMHRLVAGAISGGLIGSLSATAGMSFGQTLFTTGLLSLPATFAIGRTYLRDEARPRPRRDVRSGCRSSSTSSARSRSRRS